MHSRFFLPFASMLLGGLLVAMSVSAQSTIPAHAQSGAPTAVDIFTFSGDFESDTSNRVLVPWGACPDGQTTFGSSDPPCNSTSVFGSDSNGTFWEWTSANAKKGGGFVYEAPAAIGNEYTFFVKFEVTDYADSPYNKIVDFKEGSNDNGLYLFKRSPTEVRFELYPQNAASPLNPPETLFDLAIARDIDPNNNQGRLRIYTPDADGDFFLAFEVSDASGNAVPSGNILWLFADDGNGFEGIRGGKVYDFRFWDEALDLEQLTAQAPVGELIVEPDVEPDVEPETIGTTGGQNTTGRPSTTGTPTAVAPTGPELAATGIGNYWLWMVGAAFMIAGAWSIRRARLTMSHSPVH